MIHRWTWKEWKILSPMQGIGIQAQLNHGIAAGQRVSEEGSALVSKQKQAWRGDCAGGEMGGNQAMPTVAFLGEK